MASLTVDKTFTNCTGVAPFKDCCDVKLRLDLNRVSPAIEGNQFIDAVITAVSSKKECTCSSSTCYTKPCDPCYAKTTYTTCKCDKCIYYWTYTFTYNDEDVEDQKALSACDIQEVCCKGCTYDAIVEDLGTETFTSFDITDSTTTDTVDATDNVITFIGGTNIDAIVTAPNTVTINATGMASGEANTSSNSGAGEGLAQAKVGVDLPFKSLTAGDNVTLTGNPDDVNIAVDLVNNDTCSLDNCVVGAGSVNTSWTTGASVTTVYTISGTTATLDTTAQPAADAPLAAFDAAIAAGEFGTITFDNGSIAVVAPYEFSGWTKTPGLEIRTWEIVTSVGCTEVDTILGTHDANSNNSDSGAAVTTNTLTADISLPGIQLNTDDGVRNAIATEHFDPDVLTCGAEGLEVAVSVDGVTVTGDGTAGDPLVAVASGSGGLAFVEVTGTAQALAVDTRYTMDNAALVTGTLPAAAAVGERIQVIGKGAGGWAIAQNAGQTIHFGATDTTTGAGGSLASTNQYDVVELICTVANTDFTVISSIGSITIV